MPKRERIPVMSLYEWNLTLWAMSETRNRLDATGRGIYRELLDWCYAQGSIPDDHEAMARYCGATIEQFEAAWPLIQRHFKHVRASTNEFTNKVANVHRKQFFEFILKQRSNGAQSAKKRDRLNPEESIQSLGLAMPPLTKPSNQYETIREDTRREDTKRNEKNHRSVSPPPDEVSWIKQALLDFMSGRGNAKFSQSPDEKIVSGIWEAIAGFTTIDLREFLLELHASRQVPTKSWMWFVSIVKSEFDRRRENAAS